MSTICRDEVLAAVRAIVQQRRSNTLLHMKLIEYLQATGVDYARSTIRTHIVSRSCVNAPNQHGMKFADFEGVGRGSYRPVG